MTEKDSIKRLLVRQEFIVAVFTLLVFSFFCIATDNFFSIVNVRLLLQQYAVNGICVLGISLIVLLGGIDLSAGSILAISGAVGGQLIKMGVPVIIGLLVATAVGTLCGLVNGLIVTKLGVPAIITTIATDFAFRGALVIVTGGFWVTGFPDGLTWLSTGVTLGIPNLFWIAMILLGVLSFIMGQTNIGRLIYAVGTNSDAAAKTGINTDRIMIMGFLICGALIGFASVLYAGLYGAVSTANTGTKLGTTVLAAALAGGINFGGEGTLLGGAIGVMLLTVINNGLIQFHVSADAVSAITGAIIVIALALNALRSHLNMREEA